MHLPEYNRRLRSYCKALPAYAALYVLSSLIFGYNENREAAGALIAILWLFSFVAIQVWIGKSCLAVSGRERYLHTAAVAVLLLMLLLLRTLVINATRYRCAGDRNDSLTDYFLFSAWTMVVVWETYSQVVNNIVVRRQSME